MNDIRPNLIQKDSGNDQINSDEINSKFNLNLKISVFSKQTSGAPPLNPKHLSGNQR